MGGGGTGRDKLPSTSLRTSRPYAPAYANATAGRQNDNVLGCARGDGGPRPAGLPLRRPRENGGRAEALLLQVRFVGGDELAIIILSFVEAFLRARA